MLGRISDVKILAIDTALGAVSACVLDDEEVDAESIESIVDSTGHTLTVISRRPAATLVDLIKWIDQIGLELVDVHLKKPTLEDVFIELTGKRLRD